MAFRKIFRKLVYIAFAVTGIILCSLLVAKAQTSTQLKTVPSITAKNINGFIKNAGQVSNIEGGAADGVYYTFTSSDAEVFITARGISYAWYKPTFTDSTSYKVTKEKNNTGGAVKRHFEAERIDANLIGANLDTNTAIIEYTPNPVVFNFYSAGIQLSGMKLIQKITFKNVYKGIDWVIYNNGDNSKQQIKYDFVVQPGADPANIHIQYSPNARVQLINNGSLRIKGRFGFINEGTPVSYYRDSKATAATAYKVQGNDIYFTVKRLPNTTLPLTIDPDLFWGTILHTLPVFSGIYPSNVNATDVDIDGNNNIYLMAYCSWSMHFILKNPGGGAYYNDVYDSANGSNVYMKFSEKGVLVWATYFASGGTGGTMTVDKKGNLYCAANFIGRQLPFKNNGGYFDTIPGLFNSGKYVAKFDAAGALQWCTYWSHETVNFSDMETDEDGNFYLAGTAQTIDLPRKDAGNGAYFNAPLDYGYHPFISRFDKNCNLTWSTTIPGSDDPESARIAVDRFKNLYIIKGTLRYDDYPIVDAGGYVSKDGFSGLTKFDASLKMVWSTRLEAFDGDVTVDDDGNVYVVGSTSGRPVPRVDPGNGAYMDNSIPGKSSGGYIYKFDIKTNLLWATSYYSKSPSFFNRVVYEKYRGMIHILGHANDGLNPMFTMNDPCGDYYLAGEDDFSATDPLLISFTTGGKLVYATLTHTYNSYWQVGDIAVDNKGGLTVLLEEMQETFPHFGALKDPGNGAYFQTESENYASIASALFKLVPSNLHMTSTIKPPQSCNCNGVIALTPICGSGKYTYQWNNGGTDSMLTNVCPGNYTVKVTDVNTAATQTLPFTMPNPANAIQSATVTTTAAYCDKNNGTIAISNITGGTGPYQYTLSTVFSNEPSFKNLDTGNYFITVKDNLGCTYKDTVTIANIPGPSAIHTTLLPAACSKASGQVTVDSITGGTKPFTYALNNNNPTPVNIFNSLDTGKYVIIVTDSAGCTLPATVVIKQATGVKSVTLLSNDSICGLTSGSVVATNLRGGTKPYAFSTNNTNFSADSLFTNLSAGQFYMYIRDAEGCLFKDSITLAFKQYPVVNLPADTTICNQPTLLLDATQDNATYLWQDGSTNGKLTAGKTGSYSVNVTVNGCTTTARSSLVLLSSPVASLKVNITKCTTDTLHWDITSPLAKYLWQDGSQSPIYTATKAGDYSYTITNYCGTAYGLVHVLTQVCNCDIAVPNVFSPNGDGINDTFVPSITCTPSYYSMVIFDRTGQKLFESSTPGNNWNGTVNGKPAPVAAYYYILKFKGASDKTAKQMQGSVTILR